jgi:hypothetical protein
MTNSSSAVDGLPLWDQLLHGIGRVTQAGLQVEIQLREVLELLTLPSAAMYLAAERRTLEPLAKKCRGLLRAAGVPDAVKNAGEQTLLAALAANEKRDLVVHSWWATKSDPSTGEVKLERRTPARGTIAYQSSADPLEFVVRAETELQRAHVRVAALHEALIAHLPVLHGVRAGLTIEVTSQRQDWVRVMEDKFELLPGGGWRTEAQARDQADESA